MRFSYLFIISLLTACYSRLSIEGLDTEQWMLNEDCSTFRSEHVALVMESKEVLLEATQNEIESVLGPADEHELYERNQKFFHYRITPSDACEKHPSVQYLSIRFNALGRANEIMLNFRDQ